jgi:diphthine synthase
MLTFIGLGLYGAKDISLKGLEAIREADKVYLEFYTSRLMGTTIEEMERLYEKKIEPLNRQQVEKERKFIDEAKEMDVVFLTAGDPMVATTHIDLRMEAIKKGIEVRVIHGASIVSAVPGILGLQAYKFGKIGSIPFPEENFRPTTPYKVLLDNLSLGLHTLFLLDIKEDGRYMNPSQAVGLLLEMGKELGDKSFNEDSIVCAVSRAGSDNPGLWCGKAKDALKKDFGPPLHCLVVPGKLHFMEEEAIEMWMKTQE